MISEREKLKSWGQHHSNWIATVKIIPRTVLLRPAPLLGSLLVLLPTAAYADTGITIEYVLANILNFLTLIPSVLHRVFYVVGVVLMFQAVVRLRNYKKDANVRPYAEFIRFVGGFALFCLIAVIDISGSAFFGSDNGQSRMGEMIEATQKPADGNTINSCLKGGKCSEY